MHEWASNQHGLWSFLWALAFVFLHVSARSRGSSFEHAYKCDVECVERAEAQAEDEALADSLDKMASEAMDSSHRHIVLALLKHPFYPLFILDNVMNLISKSLTILTPA